MNPKIPICFFIFMIVFSNCKRSGIDKLPLIQEQTATNKLKSAVVRNNYYVSKSGDNSNNGSETSPFLTIQKGLAVVSAGDTVFVKTGIYNEQVTVYGKSGTASSQTTISAYPGDLPIIDGTGINIDGEGALVMIWDKFITFSGFEIRNSSKNGVTTSDEGHNLIRHNNIHDVMGQGIGLGGDNDIAEYNVVYNTSMNNYTKPGSVYNAAGISARRAPNYAIIRHNIVHDVWGEGISTFEATHTLIEDNIAFDNWSTDIYISNANYVTLQRNFVYQTKNMDKSSQVSSASQIGILLGDEKETPISAYNTIAYNIVYGCKRNLYSWGSNGSNGMNNLLIANNTFVNSTYHANVQLNPNSNSHVIIKNNIVIQNGGLLPISLKNNTELTFSNNLWSSTPNILASGMNDIVGDAKLTNTNIPYEAASYALTSSSPCINKGVKVGLATDYLNQAIIGIPDIGAYEFTGVNLITYYNAATTASAIKNDCGTGYVGSKVSATLPAKYCSSTVSQADADNKAKDILENNIQAYANANGICTEIALPIYYNTAVSGSATKNDCGTGYAGSIETGTVPARYCSSTISQADADNKALDILKKNIQIYANINGTCTKIISTIYYSAPVSGSAYRNNCGTGYTGSLVTGTVPAKYCNSTISQADADNKALVILKNNIQAYANANGTCTRTQ